MSVTGAASPRPSTPAQAWAELRDGNERFVAGTPLHPNQSVEHRSELARGQRPFASFVGCSDSRVAAEVIFDQGLGDLFVVRTAGHVLGPMSMGSLEFGSVILGVPLIIVLGHDSCGAVGAAMSAYDKGEMPPGFLRDIVESVMPSVLSSYRAGRRATDDVVAEHVRQSVQLVHGRSRIIAELVDDGRLGIVGLTYALAQGEARVVAHLGDLGL